MHKPTRYCIVQAVRVISIDNWYDFRNYLVYKIAVQDIILFDTHVFNYIVLRVKFGLTICEDLPTPLQKDSCQDMT